MTEYKVIFVKGDVRVTLETNSKLVVMRIAGEMQACGWTVKGLP